jgi:hypothetical protein
LSTRQGSDLRLDVDDTSEVTLPAEGVKNVVFQVVAAGVVKSCLNRPDRRIAASRSAVPRLIKMSRILTLAVFAGALQSCLATDAGPRAA